MPGASLSFHRLFRRCEDADADLCQAAAPSLRGFEAEARDAAPGNRTSVSFALSFIAVISGLIHGFFDLVILLGLGEFDLFRTQNAHVEGREENSDDWTILVRSELSLGLGESGETGAPSSARPQIQHG
jgi:hypothetical protein